MHLVQILLPLYDPAGKRFPSSAFDRVAHQLNERFGGVTFYARAPARGLWKRESGRTTHDDIVVCEVMADTLETEWWTRYRHRLEQAFAQEQLVIRAQEIRRL